MRIALPLAVLLLAVAPSAHAADWAAQCAAEAAQGGRAACERALRAAPDDVALRRHYALALLSAGDEEHAVSQYRRAAALAPDDPQSHFLLAVALGTINRYADSLPHVERALALDPDHHDTLVLAVVMHQHLGQTAPAFRYALRLAELGDVVAMDEVAGMYERGVGTPPDWRKSLMWLRRAAAAGHHGAMLRLRRAYLEGELGLAVDEKQAIEWANRARKARDG